MAAEALHLERSSAGSAGAAALAGAGAWAWARAAASSSEAARRAGAVLVIGSPLMDERFGESPSGLGAVAVVSARLRWRDTGCFTQLLLHSGMPSSADTGNFCGRVGGNGLVKILLVEDEPTLRHGLADLLEGA